MPPSLRDAIGWMYDYIEPNSVLLDVGCATGYFGKYIKDNKNAAVYGLEISDDKYEAKKVLDGVYSFDLDLEKWPKEIYERSYDYIFFGDILEHVKQPGIVLEKVLELLKPDGKVFISTPNVAHISTRLELINGNFEYESMGILDTTHLKYFTLHSLKQIVAKAGYTLEHVDYSTNDYPKIIQKKLLQKAGLTPTARYWKMTESKEARAFQYKLILSKATGKKSDIKYEKLPEKPEQFRDDILKRARGQVEDLRGHAAKQAEIIDHYTKENERLTKENEKFKSKSITHKFKQVARKALRR